MIRTMAMMVMVTATTATGSYSDGSYSTDSGSYSTDKPSNAPTQAPTEAPPKTPTMAPTTAATKTTTPATPAPTQAPTTAATKTTTPATPAPAGSIATPVVTAASISTKIDNQPAATVESFPPPPTLNPTQLNAQVPKDGSTADTVLVAPAGQEIAKKDARVAEITSPVPGIGACALAEGTTPKAKGTRDSIAGGFQNILTGSSKTNDPSDLRTTTSNCKDTLGTASFRRLAGTGATFTVDVAIPSSTSGDTTALEASIKTRVQAAAISGALVNAIKTEASNLGVLTEAMQTAAPQIDAADLTMMVTTKKVDTLVFKATDKKKKDLSGGEIAAIVICSMVLVAGVIYGIMKNAGGDSGGKIPSQATEDALDGVGGYDDGYDNNDV